MQIFDITRTVQEAPLYPGEAAPVITPRTENIGSFHTSDISAGSHIGTHADAFSHLLPDGLTVDKMPLELYCGPCRVLTVPGNALIRLEDIRGRLGGVERILLRGGGNTFLCEEAAEYLVACGVKAVGTEAVSVAPGDNEEQIHALLMRGGVAILENLTLECAEDGDYLLFAFPVKYGGCDGAPVRAVLLRADD